MKDELKYQIVNIYREWLADYASDELHTKDQLINAEDNMFYWEEFVRIIEEDI